MLIGLPDSPSSHTFDRRRMRYALFIVRVALTLFYKSICRFIYRQIYRIIYLSIRLQFYLPFYRQDCLRIEPPICIRIYEYIFTTKKSQQVNLENMFSNYQTSKFSSLKIINLSKLKTVKTPNLQNGRFENYIGRQEY